MEGSVWSLLDLKVPSYRFVARRTMRVPFQWALMCCIVELLFCWAAFQSFRSLSSFIFYLLLNSAE